MMINSYSRYCVAFVLIIIIASEVIAQDTKEQNFSNGVHSYTSGNYEEALRLWTDIYNTGYLSPQLAYNIANANFKLNKIPDAILFYERARLLDPADEDIEYNLMIARGLVTDKFEEIPELFFVRWYNFIALILLSNSWAKISLGTFVACLLMLSLYLYSSKYRIKVIGFWLAMSFLLISIFTISLSVRNRSLVYGNKFAVLFCPVVHGKSSPDNSGTDLFVLHEGTKVTIEDEVGEWLEIRLSDGNKGWVPSNCLQII
jgi:hypothetical protein